ncbi:MAG: glycosyltransferase family 4 protein [Pseudomonadota bacterium]
MIALLLTLASSALMCGAYLHLARRWHIVDQPNTRSSHEQPTPHGGGTPLMLSFTLGVIVYSFLYKLLSPIYAFTLAAAIGLCLIGVIDDIRGLSARFRLAAYAVACALFVSLLPPPLPLLTGLWTPLASALIFIALLWLVNLYNFMDGIDGIAAIQCFVACCSAALLTWWRSGEDTYAMVCLLLAASHLGFLLWNFPPARLFLGDAGSVPTGFLLGALALIGEASGSLPAACWIILLAAFLVDATWTLLRRMLHGERFMEAHRSHGYQRLALHWGGHLPVDLLLLAINGLWLFPLAALTAAFPQWQWLLVILAFLPLSAGMAILGKLA